MAFWRVAGDIGCTFNDVVLLEGGRGVGCVDRTLSTPALPLNGVRAGVNQRLAKSGVQPSDITAPIGHATTLITNALIEGKTGKAAMVTTAGFGDTPELRSEQQIGSASWRERVCQYV